MIVPEVHALISSLSRKIPLVRCVRKGLDKLGAQTRLTGADIDPNCIGKYFVDHFWKMPLLADLRPDTFISHCREFGINRVIPTRDGELLFYAENRDLFSMQGIEVMVSESEGVKRCLDKLLFYQTIERMGLPVIETSENIENLDGDRFVVKERHGAGSRSIGLGLSRKEALRHAQKLKRPLFQPYLEGREISVDLYVNRLGRAKGVVLRDRVLVVEGESQVTETFRDEELEALCARAAEELRLYGHVMFQLIQDQVSGSYHFLESNPRFGGASTLSLAAGLDSFYWFFLEASGQNLSEVPFERSKENKRLVRYAEDLIQSCNTTV